MRRHQRRRDDPPALVMNLQEARDFPVDDGAVDVGELDGQALGSARRDLLRHLTDVRHFRERVGGPRNHQGADSPPAEKQRVLDHDARHRICGVGELVRGAHVAGRENTPVRRPQPIVDRDAAVAGGNTRRIEIEALRVRCAADGDQHGMRLDGTSIDLGLDLSVRLGKTTNRRTRYDPHAVVRQSARHDVGGIRILTRKKPRQRLHDRDAGAKQRKCLCQLASDRAAAYHEQ